MGGERRVSTSSGTFEHFPVVAFVTLVSLAIYLFFLPASVYWLDSPEFMSAAAKLALPHPPGHPVAVLLMKFFMMLPIGDVPFRANLFGAFFGALSAGMVAGISKVVAVATLRRIGYFRWRPTSKPGAGRNAGEVEPAGLDDSVLFRPATFLALCSGFMFAGCRSMFIQSMAAEVYTLNAALLLGALYGLMSGKAGDARRGMAAGVLLGLALANHHFLALLCVPALVVAFWVDLRSSLKPLLAIALVSVLTALGCYMYVAVRGAGDAWPAWGRITGVGDFLWYVSASIFSQSVGGFEQTGGGPLKNLALAISLIGTTMGLASIWIAFLGNWFAARCGVLRHAFSLALLFLGGLSSKVMMGLLDPSNPDDHGYMLAALAFVAVFVPLATWFPAGASGAAFFRRKLIRIGWVVLAALLAAVPFFGGIDLGLERSRFDHTNRVAALALNDVPTGAVTFVSHYPVFFVLQYQQEVEDARPDMTLVQESLYYKARGGGWYAAEIARRDPSLAGLMDDFRRSGRFSWTELQLLAATRPVLLEASPDFGARMEDLTFDGWFFRVQREEEGGFQTAREFAHKMAVMLLPASELNIETRRVAIRNLASSADWLVRAGDRRAAAELLDTALKFNPMDRTLRSRFGELTGKYL